MHAAGLAVIGFTLVACTIRDPGLTVDEPINVGHGKRLIWMIGHRPKDVVQPDGIMMLWGAAHDHPPLARLLIGLCHAIADPYPDDRDIYDPIRGRVASAAAFAVIIYLSTKLAFNLAGATAGLVSGLTVCLMPRLFAHAHLASPEVIAAALHLAGVSAAVWAVAEHDRGTARSLYIRFAIAGCFAGLALLAKLTAILLPVGVLASMLWCRRRAACPLCVYAACGLVVFVAGWPWLWPIELPGYSPGIIGTMERLREFASTGVERATIFVWYFGRQYPNAESGVPWHFVWVYFLVTVPAGLQLFGIAFGLPHLVRDASGRDAAAIVLISLGVVLAAFSLPIHRYDGERLFLMAFPLWAVVIGVGARIVFERLAAWRGREFAAVALAVFVAAQSIGVVQFHPVQLSYYNGLVGGLAGAEWLGLEATYWGDTVTVEFLEQFAELADQNDHAALFPTLYDGHPVRLTSPGMERKHQLITSAERMRGLDFRWAIVFHRQGYIHDPNAKAVMQRGELIHELRRQGVWLTRLYRLPNGTTRTE